MPDPVPKSSGFVRAICAVAASIITASLFGAVVVGLTGDGGQWHLAHAPTTAFAVG